MSESTSTETSSELTKFSRPATLTEEPFTYCPGCHHGIINRLIAECIEEMDLQGRVVGTAPVGCAVFQDRWFNFDIVQPPHGRVSATATGLKRANPELVVFAYQGDGDFSSIGTGNSVHAANRGENISVFFINNTVYGMTGGEMAPTSLIGQKTTTTPMGREAKETGYPIKMSKMLAQLDAPVYITRQAVYDIQHIKQAKRSIKKSFRIQVEGRGYSLVELLSACPTNWGVDPLEAIEKIQEEIEPIYPLGDLVDQFGGEMDG
ncbi:MAG: thiamine pyrophosphate-dependent enzyme [Candidatus Acetothermia bacterium]